MFNINIIIAVLQLYSNYFIIISQWNNVNLIVIFFIL